MREATVIVALIAALCASGCALFEPTRYHEGGLYSSVEGWQLSPEHLKSVPQLSHEETTEEPIILADGSLARDADGSVIMRRTQVSRSWGIPPAPRRQTFSASEALADSDTSLNQNADWTGTSVSASRAQAGNVGTATVAGQTQVARTETVAGLAGDIVEGAVRGAIGAVQELEATKRLSITEKQATERIRIQHEPQEHAEEPAPAEPAPPVEAAP